MPGLLDRGFDFNSIESEEPEYQRIPLNYLLRGLRRRHVSYCEYAVIMGTNTDYGERQFREVCAFHDSELPPSTETGLLKTLLDSFDSLDRMRARIVQTSYLPDIWSYMPRKARDAKADKEVQDVVACARRAKELGERGERVIALLRKTFVDRNNWTAGQRWLAKELTKILNK